MKMRRLMSPFSASTSPFISLDIGVPPQFIVALMRLPLCKSSETIRETAASPSRGQRRRPSAALFFLGADRICTILGRRANAARSYPRGERPMTPHPATIALRLAALIFLVASCHPARILAADAPAPPPAVTVSQPIPRALVERDEYTGQFAAKEYVEIRARGSGHLTEIHFEDGQIVKEGDLLFVIDPRPYEATLAAARAQLAQA